MYLRKLAAELLGYTHVAHVMGCCEDQKITSPGCSLHTCTHCALFLGFLPFLNSGREWKTWDFSLPLVQRNKALNPHHICLLWSWELNACLLHGDVILFGSKLKLKFMRRSRAEWTKGCCNGEMCSKAGWCLASESSHSGGNSLSMATVIQGVQVALLPLHVAGACFNQTFLQCTVT